ncbi:hypothetical protein OG225_40780 (plasmid) [Nocardia sp. NBC_01377]|uniref:hypothetical protein n=1 Tax=Nocardia TaxID=1817 RepID=UPI001C23BF25|nr:hypothetical protein [Nocardia noduli]
MSLPTQQEIFTNALRHLDLARAALAESRDWLASDWAGVETGLSLPREVGEQRTRVRTAISAAKNEVDDARHALHEALRHYAPPEHGRVLEDPRAEIADDRGTR